MKIWGEVLSATERFEFENLNKFGKCSRLRAAPETEEYRNISTYSEQVLAHTVPVGTQQS